MEIVWILIIAALFGGFFWWAHKAEKKRNTELCAALVRSGFLVEPGDKSPSEFALGQIALLSHVNGRASNIARKSESSRSILFFEYAYRSGKHTYTFSVLCLRGGFELPKFTLGPEDFFSKMAQAVGYADIDFAEDDKFSKMFVLRGPDKNRITNFFTPALRDKLKQFPKIRLETSDQAIIALHEPRVLEVNAIPDWIEQTRSVLSSLVDSVQAPV